MSVSLLRLAGRAALIAAGAHLLQFLVLGIGPVLNELAFPDAAHAGDNYWFGLIGTITFTVIALAYLVFFPAAARLVRGAGPSDDVWTAALRN